MMLTVSYVPARAQSPAQKVRVKKINRQLNSEVQGSIMGGYGIAHGFVFVVFTIVAFIGAFVLVHGIFSANQPEVFAGIFVIAFGVGVDVISGIHGRSSN
jgi:hypothetical protein